LNEQASGAVSALAIEQVDGRNKRTGQPRLLARQEAVLRLASGAA
jgi:hypothetical protein